MVQKTAILLMSLSSICFATDGLPDPNNWFLQPLGWNAMSQENPQISDSYVVWQRRLQSQHVDLAIFADEWLKCGYKDQSRCR